MIYQIIDLVLKGIGVLCLLYIAMEFYLLRTGKEHIFYLAPWRREKEEEFTHWGQ